MIRDTGLFALAGWLAQHCSSQSPMEAVRAGTPTPDGVYLTVRVRLQNVIACGGLNRQHAGDNGVQLEQQWAW